MKSPGVRHPPRERLRPLASVRAGVRLAVVALVSFVPRAAAGDEVPRRLLLDGSAIGQDIVAVGEQGVIVRSPDAGRSWQRVATPVRTTLTAVTFAPNGQRGWAVGHDALILATNDAGRTWSRQFQGKNREQSFLDVLALTEQRVIAIGAFGLFMSTSDGGRTWQSRTILNDEVHLNRLTRGPTGTLYIAGEAGTLLRSPDDGSTWVPMRAPYDGSFYGVAALDARTLVAYGLEGQVHRSTDEGATWSKVPTPGTVLLATSAVLADGTVLLGGYARTLLLSRDGGTSFTAAPRAPESAIAELVALPDGRVMGLGESGMVTFDFSR